MKKLLFIAILVLLPCSVMAGNVVTMFATGPDTTNPAFSSAGLAQDGVSATVTLSEDVVITLLDNGDFVFTGSTTGAVGLESCTEVAGVISCTLASAIGLAETVTVAYIGGVDEVEDLSGNDLLVFSGEPVTVDGVGVDYTAFAECVGAYFMNDTGDELSECGTSTLVETSGTIPTVPTIIPGFSGTARDFEKDESEWLLQLDGGPLDVSGPSQTLTMSAVVAFESRSGDQVIFDKYATTGSQRSILWKYDNADDAIEFLISSDGITFTRAQGATGWATIGDGLPHHLMVVYDGVDVRMYLDGVLDSNGSLNPAAHTTGIFDSTAAAYIGNNSSGYELDGPLDEFLYLAGYAASASEVVDIRDNGISGDKGGSD